VALLNKVLVADAVARGVLEAPFGPELEVPGWTVLRHRDRRRGAAQQAVWDWLAGLRDTARAGRGTAMA
jgi:hypothetical protein